MDYLVDLDLGTMMTDQEGIAFLNWICEVDPDLYDVRVETLLHPGITLSAENIFAITKEDDLNLMVTATPDVIEAGETTHILVQLLEDGNPLQNKRVTIGINPTFAEGCHAIVGTFETDSSGMVAIDWECVPESFQEEVVVPGNYEVVTYFLGEDYFIDISSIAGLIIQGTIIMMGTGEPDLDLHVYDGEGRHVGVNYDKNEIEIEIPGALYSGDLVSETEWIYLPLGVIDYYIIIDARDAHLPTEEYQLTITMMPSSNETIQITKNATIEAGSKDTWVPQINPDTGKLELPNLETTITGKLEQLCDAIMQLNDTAFDKNPIQQKNILNNKIQEVFEMVKIADYEGAYEKLLHDIKPKLTGLKTDENGNPWGNGIFKNPWIIDLEAQEMLNDYCNSILFEIKLII
jgi:hypothetical protein